MADEKIGLEAVLEDEDFQKGLGSFQSGLDSMSQQTGVVADLVSGIFMGLGMKIVEWGASAVLAIGDTFAQIGQAIWENGQLMDEAFDGIAIATGATGEELALLQEDFRTVFASVPVDAQTVSEAISLLNQRFEVTGETLTDLATPLLEASRMMGEDAAGNATALADAMGLWNVSTEDGAGLLDELFVAAQESGMGMGTLLSTLTTSTPALQAMGFSLDESIALLATFEDAGINSSTAVLGMRTALASFTADGIPAREGLAALIAEIEGAATPTDAMNTAIEAFGTRAGPAMVTAIQNGTFNLEEMLEVLEGADGKIMDTAASTADFGEQWQIFQNKSQLALEPLGIAVLGMATSIMDKLAPAFDTLIGIFTTDFLPLITTYVIPFIDELIAAFGRLAVGNFEGAMRGLFSPEIANTIIAIKDTFVGFWDELTGAFDRLAAGNFAGAMRGLFPPEVANYIIAVKDVLVTLWNEALVPVFEWLGTNLPLAMGALSEFWTGTLLPVVTAIWEWFGTNLPIAISALTTFWTGTLMPTFTAFSGWFTTSILPVFQGLADWFTTVLPVSLAGFKETWDTNVGPVIEGMVEAFSKNVLPIIQDVAAWFGEYLPIGLNALATIWKEVLWPAIEIVINWVIENVLPALGTLFTWLMEQLPVAIQALSDFWTDTLLPAIEDVSDFITGTVIPVLSDIWAWLSTNVPAAIQTLSDYWNNTLLPAITGVSDFFTGTVFPIFEDLTAWLSDKIYTATTTLSDLWNNTLLPAITDVRDFIANQIFPAFEDMGTNLETMGTNVKAFLTDAWDGFVGGVQSAATALGDVIKFIGDLATAVANFDIEALWALIGQSPSPLAIGLMSVSDALPSVINGMRELFDVIDEGRDAADVIDDTVERFGDLSLSKGFSSFGGAVYSRFKKDTVDPLEKNLKGLTENIADAFEKYSKLGFGSIDELREATALYGMDIIPPELQREVEVLLEMDEARAEMAERYAEAQRVASEYQKAQQDFAFLQQQMDFLDFLKENKLDAADILGGIQLGLDADMPALLAAMAKAMQQLIGIAEGELEIGSPSHVFSAIAENVMDSMTNTITGLANLPGRAMQTAMDAMITPARAAVPIMSGAISKTMNVNMTNNISQGADFGQFEAMLDRYFARAFA